MNMILFLLLIPLNVFAWEDMTAPPKEFRDLTVGPAVIKEKIKTEDGTDIDVIFVEDGKYCIARNNALYCPE